MTIKKIVLILVSIVFCVSTCSLAFAGCSKLPAGVYNGDDSMASLVQDGDNYYAKISTKGLSSIKVVDPKGKAYNFNVDPSVEEYTVVAFKDGKGYSVEAWPQKKAVVWVTALLAGGFYDSDYYEYDYDFDKNEDIVTKIDKPVWDPLPWEDVNLIDYINPDTLSSSVTSLVTRLLSDKGVLNSLVGPILKGAENLDDDEKETNLLWNLGLYGDGTPHNPGLVPANGYDGRIQYGVLGAYQDHAKNLRSKYEDLDVVIFNYDWRYDNRDSVAALQKCIYDNKFTDVVLCSHSLGGNIVAGYLAKQSLNRDIVKRYVSFGGAFLGSFDALFAIENAEQYLTAVMENMGLDIFSLLPESMLEKKDAVFAQVQDLLTNMYSFPQLVPTYELISGRQYGPDGDGDAFTVDGKVITTEAELYAFYESRPWAWKTNASGEYVYDANGNHVIREVVKDLKNYHDSLYVVDADGNKTFSTKLVDTYYVTGNQIITFCGADYVTKGAPSLTYRTTLNGDKQVLLYSTLVNQDPSTIAPDHFIIVKGEDDSNKDHFQVGCDFGLVGNIIYDAVDAVFYPDKAKK